MFCLTLHLLRIFALNAIIPMMVCFIAIMDRSVSSEQFHPVTTQIIQSGEPRNHLFSCSMPATLPLAITSVQTPQYKTPGGQVLL